jgi:hypothetical protein
MGIIMSEQTTTTTNAPTLDETIEAAFDKDQYTPYQMAGVVNSLLSSLADGKEIPPQMVYQYVTKGYIKGERTTVTMKKGKTETRQGWTVSRASALEWTKKYVAKNVT